MKYVVDKVNTCELIQHKMKQELKSLQGKNSTLADKVEQNENYSCRHNIVIEGLQEFPD